MGLRSCVAVAVGLYAVAVGLYAVAVGLCAVAVALISPLAWELPYAAGAALKKSKKRKRGAGEDLWVRRPVVVQVCGCPGSA